MIHLFDRCKIIYHSVNKSEIHVRPALSQIAKFISLNMLSRQCYKEDDSSCSSKYNNEDVFRKRKKCLSALLKKSTTIYWNDECFFLTLSGHDMRSSMS